VNASILANLLLPGSGQLIGALEKKKKEKQNFMANPLARLGATFGLVDGPAPLTADDMGIIGPLSTEQESNLALANALLGKQSGSFLGGIGGKAIAGIGSGIRSIFNAL
jgi:hypothetical protein